MTKCRDFADVELPETWDEWGREAKMNFLCGAMDSEQLSNLLRERAGLDQRDKPMFTKREKATIIAELEGI
jgi:hypothetical protein